MKRFACIPSWFIAVCITTFIQGLVAEQTNIFSVIRQYNTNMSVAEPNENSTIANNTQIKVSRDYILKIQFTLNEATVIPYLRDLIYNEYDMIDVTTEDLIELSNFKEYDLNQSLEVLRKLNISEDIISVNTFRLLLEISNMTFNDFFEKLKNTTNLNGAPLQAALGILNISPSNFSTAVTFGDQSAVFDVLSKGVYTREKLEEAAKTVDTDLPTFYKNVKAIILDQMKTKSITNYVERLKIIPMFDRKLYENIWTILNLNMSDVYRVVNLRRIVSNISNRLNENTTLGVATTEHEIVMHKKIYSMVHPVKDIVNIYASSVINPATIYDKLTISMKSADNSFVLWSNDSISKVIDLGAVDKNIENCSYIAVNNNVLIETPVTVTNVSSCCVIVKTLPDTSFNLGNPLICNEKLIGLATMSDKEKNLFAFDGFYQKSDENNQPGSDATKTLFSAYPHLIMLLFLVLLC